MTVTMIVRHSAHALRRSYHWLFASRMQRLRRFAAQDAQHAEVFPWMGQTAAAAAVVAAGLVCGLGVVLNLDLVRLAILGFVGAVAGALAGICLALNWAVPVPVRGLWDQWLDGGRSAAEPTTAPSPGPDPVVAVIEEPAPERPRVRPHVLSPETGDALALEDEVAPMLAEHTSGAIRLVGGPGFGKSTALRHLARLVPPYLNVAFLDGCAPAVVTEAALRGLVVYASPTRPAAEHLAILRLAPWGQDEWIEYLLAGDRRLCASVMSRLARRKDECGLLAGIPELWSVALDRMAEDEAIDGPCTALRLELAAQLGDRQQRELIEADCLAAILVKANPLHVAEILMGHDPGAGLLSLIRHRPIQLLLAADRIATELKRGSDCNALVDKLPYDLVREAAEQIDGDPGAVGRLRWLLKSDLRGRHPMAASLLQAMAIGWQPESPLPRLSGAYLNEAQWPGIDLARAEMRGADLSAAALTCARLESAILDHARLTDAILSSARLNGASFPDADLTRANLSGAMAAQANFRAARLTAANLEGAMLEQAVLNKADLTNARFQDAQLAGADLACATLDGADFTGADLARAVLRGLKLTVAQFRNARFTGADLSGCDLEGMELPRAIFAESNLRKALLTDSRLPNADFRGACLCEAGLAEVKWEGACLRGADLRNATFHLGSTRSGMVGSPIASEGTRTGFYTDDFEDREFQNPEDIRKANLCGADLRGANLDKTDFYLVDLRGARLDTDQIRHIRRCGGILEDRD